jgi:hypothetical protein
VADALASFSRIGALRSTAPVQILPPQPDDLFGPCQQSQTRRGPPLVDGSLAGKIKILIMFAGSPRRPSGRIIKCPRFSAVAAPLCKHCFFCGGPP